MSRHYIVQDEFFLYYGSTTQRSATHRRTICRGERLTLDSQAFNGNVWFIDSAGSRGKIECGSVANLERRGLLRPDTYM